MKSGEGMQIAKKKKKRLRPVWIVALTAVLLLVAGYRLQIAIQNYTKDFVNYVVTKEINTIVSNRIYVEKEKYAGLVSLERDNENSVTALTTDMITLNNIKTEIINAVYDGIHSLEESNYKVHIGNIISPNFLTGAGPEIPLGFIGLGYVKGEFASSFTSAGINQTRHNIILEMEVNVTVMQHFGSYTLNVESSFPVTDTILIGTVPESYTYIEDTRENLLGKINDYKEN